MRKKKNKRIKNRNFAALGLILKTGGHSGKHANKNYSLIKGRSRKNKHVKKSEEMTYDEQP